MNGGWKFVLTLALTFYPLPLGEEISTGRFRFCGEMPGQSRRGFFKKTANGSPSPPTGVGGEGWGEVARETNYLVAVRQVDRHQTAVEFLSREGRKGGEVRRTGIFVDPAMEMNQAP